MCAPPGTTCVIANNQTAQLWNCQDGYMVLEPIRTSGNIDAVALDQADGSCAVEFAQCPADRLKREPQKVRNLLAREALSELCDPSVLREALQRAGAAAGGALVKATRLDEAVQASEWAALAHEAHNVAHDLSGGAPRCVGTDGQPALPTKVLSKIPPVRLMC